MSQAESGSVPLWWIIAFVVVALGLGALVVTTVGGSLVVSGGGVVLPVPV